MSTEPRIAVGVDLGATHMKIVVVDGDGAILRSCHIPTTPDWPRELKDQIAKIDLPIDAIGVAAPGLAAGDGRSIWWMGGRMELLVGFDFGEHLGRNVRVLNDAHAALLGEAWLGAARGFRHIVMLTLGTGVGGAIMSDGRLLRGHIGRAGHLGHVIVDAAGEKDIVNTPGSLEDAIGECTLAARSYGRFTTTRDLIAAYTCGDDDAACVWLSSVRALGASLAAIVNVVDPALVILGGGIAQAGEALVVPLEELMDQFEWRPHGRRVKIVTAMLGERAGALGAAKHALESE